MINVRKVMDFKYISWIAVITSWLAAILVFFIGAKKFTFLVIDYFKGVLGTDVLDAETVVLVQLLAIIDTFLFGLVLIIFAFGVYQLFLSRLPRNEGQDEKSTIPWQNITSLTQLKAIIGEVILLMLIVLFAKNSFLNNEHYEWSGLVLPISILLIGLTIALWKFFERGKH
jgi:uncharacterized membrane protein YqhA